MKILGLLIVIAISVVGYCVYNPMVVDSADFTNVQKGKSSSSDCKGPFGVDSQKILNEKLGEYVIGVVSEIDLEKNSDGTWYVDNCELSNMLPNNRGLYFTSPYPQQNDLKEGDFIGFIAESKLITSGGQSFYYRSGKILDHISSQSVRCRIDDISELSTPARGQEDLGDVTGVVMAVEIKKNKDPEPDNPDDFQINTVVMKFADGNLYIVRLYFEYEIFKGNVPREYSEYGVLKGVNLPSHNAFAEGDVVTLKQFSHVTDASIFEILEISPYLGFGAFYKEE